MASFLSRQSEAHVDCPTIKIRMGTHDAPTSSKKQKLKQKDVLQNTQVCQRSALASGSLSLKVLSHLNSPAYCAMENISFFTTCDLTQNHSRRRRKHP